MFDDVQGRRFLEQPARKNLAPVRARRTLNHDLHKCTGQLVSFPVGGRLARFQLDDQVADPNALTGLQFQVARQAIALVKDAQRRDALRHRRIALLRLDDLFDLCTWFWRGLGR
jgi:hypothetical protein